MTEQLRRTIIMVGIGGVLGGAIAMTFGIKAVMCFAIGTIWGVVLACAYS